MPRPMTKKALQEKLEAALYEHNNHFDMVQAQIDALTEYVLSQPTEK